MSEYISVADYDQHEEKHAYYIDMLSKIIDILLQNRKQRSMTKCRILEFGAGTGILSTRLASISNSEIHVVEIDWACYQVLVGKFRQNGARQLEVSADNRQHRFEMPNGNSVVTHNEDSRFYNPVGSYDYIVTSFADHHIKASDKQLYFANVKQNLNEGALFIVGDEFLREHDPTDEGT
jgi:SAM-dependent methyltransferase